MIYTLTLLHEKRKRKRFKKFKEELAEDLCDKSYTLDTLQTEEKTEQEHIIAVSKSNIPKHLVAHVPKDRNCSRLSTCLTSEGLS